MVQMKQVLEAWGQPEFENALKSAISRLGNTDLPLQAGLAAGSYALDAPLNVMLISASERAGSIVAKVGIFYRSLMPGCACAGDPTVEDEQNEHCTMLVTIDKTTADAHFELLEE